MSKINLSNIGNLQNEVAAVAAINSNSALLTQAVENSISRDGSQPNNMNSELDMNSNKIINLPDAYTDQEPVTYGQFIEGVTSLANGAVIDASFITLGTHPAITNERVLTVSSNIGMTDGGPQSTLDIHIEDGELNALAAVNSDVDKLPYFTGESAADVTDFTPYARTILDDIDAEAARETLGIILGTDVQPHDNFLDSLVSSGTGVLVKTDAATATHRIITGTSNEITLTNGDGVTGNPTVSLPSALTFTGKTVTGGSFTSPVITTPTGITKGDVGLGNVDNTSDSTKNAASVTLTNKIISGSDNNISGITNSSLSSAADGTIKSNISGVSASPSDNTISDVLDKRFGNTRGSVVYRGASTWDSLAPGTSGNILTTQGAGADPAWMTVVGTGDMLSSIYDPASVSDNAFDGLPVADRTTLAGIDQTLFTTAFLREDGVEGAFVWDSSDLSAEVTADPNQGSVVAPTAASTGASGAWRRIRPLSNLHKTSEYGGDIAKAMTACSAMGGGTVEINTLGTIVPPAGLTKPANVELVGLGSGKTIIKPAFTSISDFASLTGDGGGDWVLACQDGNNGSMTELPAFSDIGPEELALTFTSAHGLSVGDEVCFYDTTDGSFYAARTYYRRGERHIVMGVDGLRVYFEYGVLDTYIYGANVKAYKVHKWGGKLGGFTIDASGVAGSLGSWGIAKIFRAAHAEIDDIEAFACDSSGIEFDQCIGLRPTRIRSSSQMDGTADAQNYPLLISNSTDVIVTDSVGRGVWSGGDIGGYNTPGGIQSYKSGYERCTISNTGTSPAAGVHGNSQECFYRFSKIDGGACLGGLNFTLESCEVRVWRGDCPVLYYGSDVVGGRFDILNCRAFSQKNGGGSLPTAQAAVYFNVEPNAKSEVFLNIRGGCIVATAETRPFYLEEMSTSAPLSYCIEDIDVSFGSTNTDGFIRVIHKTGAATPTYAVQRNIRGFTQSRKWASWENGYVATTMEMPRQKGIWSSTSTATTSMDSLISLPRSYPTGYQVGAVAMVQSNDLGPNVVTIIRSVGISSVRPLIATAGGTNFTAGVGFTVAWETW